MLKFLVEREDDNIEVLLLPHKDGSGYSYINTTKGHICPCKFNTIEEALDDMKNNPKVIRYLQIE